MEAKSVASNGIVHEVLTKDNYKRWKTLMKNYLLGQDLWVVVENASEVADEVSRRMNNAKALHIIQLSCGPGILDEISHFETAKEAWNYLSAQYGKELKAKRDTEQAKEAWVHLSARYGRELKATPDIEQGLLMDDSLRECKELHRQVEGGNWDAAYLSISEDREAIFSASASGRTVLHVAVIAGHVKIVDKLVKLGKDKLVEMKDKEGYTALALAAHYTGNTKIAKCMVEKEGGVREDLLAMENKHREIPVLLAAANGHKEMTRYLYSKTPREVLDGEDSRNRLLLLSRCITADIFDVALRLLQRYPQLARESLLSDECSALHALANMPSAFPSGRHRSELLHQHYYRIINVERKFQDEYGVADIMNIVPFVIDEGRQKTSSAGSIYLFGWLPIFQFLLPVKILGVLLLLGMELFSLTFFEIITGGEVYRKIYDEKYAHYEVRGILLYLYKSIAEFNDSQLQAASAYDAMLDAAKHGIVEFINVMRKANPDLLWAMDSSKRGIISYAILNRKENVFRLILGLNGQKQIHKYCTDVFGNNLLHLAGHLGPSSVLDRSVGATLQMQREIQWFEAVKEVVNPKYKEGRNDDGKKAHEVFTENHKELMKDGEKWAKETAGSFMLVGILITTIVFAAAFTIPGGSNPDNGMPIYLHNNIFALFFISNAISFFTAVTSVLMFIAIFTSRYAEKDFLSEVPGNLLRGLIFLSVSLLSAIVAFSAVFVLTLQGNPSYQSYMTVTLDVFTAYPVFGLMQSQLRIMRQIFRSMRSN